MRRRSRESAGRAVVKRPTREEPARVANRYQ